MTEIRHITPREQALERENARLVDKTERQAATIHVQAVAIQAMKEEIEGWKLDQKENIVVTIKQQEEIAKLKADAERYQFIREGAFSGGWNYTEVPGDWTKGMDKTIDKAMAAMKESK